MVQATKMEATRAALGPTLIKLRNEGLDIVCVDADLGYSTSAVKFGREFPERFFPVGVAEQNMIGVAAGLAATGKIAFCSSFAVFAPGHCFDQLRMAVAQPKTNVKLVASHAGLVTGEDGASAQSLEDIGLMLSMRAKTAVVHDESYRFQLGKWSRLREGSDVTLIAIADMVKVALDAAELLSSDGINARVLNAASLRPLDREAIVAAADETGAIVTAEDHFVHGGLGSLVAGVVAEEHPVPIEFVGMRDRYGTSGTSEQVLAFFNLTPEAVAESAKKAIDRKSE